jgi:hypothetical protein
MMWKSVGEKKLLNPDITLKEEWLAWAYLPTDCSNTDNCFCLLPSTALTSTPAYFNVGRFGGMSSGVE